MSEMYILKKKLYLKCSKQDILNNYYISFFLKINE